MAARSVQARFEFCNHRTRAGVERSTRFSCGVSLAVLLSVLATSAVAMDVTQDTRSNGQISQATIHDDTTDKLVFWLKATNEDATGWQGGPFIRLDGDAGQQYHIEPKPGMDHMRNAEHNEACDGWRLFEIPLRGNDQWQSDGEIPTKIRALVLVFDSWGAPTPRFTIEGLAVE